MPSVEPWRTLGLFSHLHTTSRRPGLSHTGLIKDRNNGPNITGVTAVRQNKEGIERGREAGWERGKTRGGTRANQGKENMLFRSRFGCCFVKLRDSCHHTQRRKKARWFPRVFFKTSAWRHPGGAFNTERCTQRGPRCYLHPNWLFSIPSPCTLNVPLIQAASPGGKGEGEQEAKALWAPAGVLLKWRPPSDAGRYGRYGYNYRGRVLCDCMCVYPSSKGWWQGCGGGSRFCNHNTFIERCTQNSGFTSSFTIRWQNNIKSLSPDCKQPPSPQIHDPIQQIRAKPP